MSEKNDTQAGLELLREPFPAHQISKLPKGNVMLDYVGHAALTDRLLDADPSWNWEPLAFGSDGLPVFDATGGLWIKLTVCGVTRLGYGHAGKKSDPGAREKEVIGDALRNAAMRFGAALDLWHKGQLHIDGESSQEAPEEPVVPNGYDKWEESAEAVAIEGVEALKAFWKTTPAMYREYATGPQNIWWEGLKRKAGKVLA